MNKDTIDYVLEWKENEDYQAEYTAWVADDDRWEEDEPQKTYRCFHLLLNGEPISQYTSPEELINTTTQKQCYGNRYWYPIEDDYDTVVVTPRNDNKWSEFQPFTCSCGVSGCAGIWDGVHLKVRKHTVEWRMKKNCGYEFLDKLFFQFDREQYFDMIDKLKHELREKLCSTYIIT